MNIKDIQPRGLDAQIITPLGGRKYGGQKCHREVKVIKQDYQTFSMAPYALLPPALRRNVERERWKSSLQIESKVRNAYLFGFQYSA